MDILRLSQCKKWALEVDILISGHRKKSSFKKVDNVRSGHLRSDQFMMLNVLRSGHFKSGRFKTWTC